LSRSDLYPLCLPHWPSPSQLDIELFRANVDRSNEIERIGVIYDPDTLQVHGLYTDHLKVIGPKLGIDVISSPFRNAAELEPIIRAFESNPKSGLLVLPDVTTSKNRATIIEAAAKYRLPSIYSYAHFPKDGGLMSYGVDPVEWRAVDGPG
jgi:putative tryptophan/tyrosine transport system substrate-binding protein